MKLTGLGLTAAMLTTTALLHAQDPMARVEQETAKVHPRVRR